MTASKAPCAPVVVVRSPQDDPDYEEAAEAANVAVSLLPTAVGGLLAAAAKVMAESDAMIVAAHFATTHGSST